MGQIDANAIVVEQCDERAKMGGQQTDEFLKFVTVQEALISTVDDVSWRRGVLQRYRNRQVPWNRY